MHKLLYIAAIPLLISTILASEFEAAAHRPNSLTIIIEEPGDQENSLLTQRTEMLDISLSPIEIASRSVGATSM